MVLGDEGEEMTIVNVEKINGRNYVLFDDVQKDLSIQTEALVWCKEFFLNRDRMNAKIHCAPLRLSPITERVILALKEELPKS